MITESGQHQTNRLKKNVRKVYLRTRKFLETKLYSRNLIKRINTWAELLWKILGTILKVNKGGNQTNRPRDKEIDDYAQGFTHVCPWCNGYRRRKWTW